MPAKEIPVSVRLTHFALDEFECATVLRGVLDPDTLEDILVDVYQREVLHQEGKKHSLIEALRNGARVPDVEIGMRGDNFSIEGEGEGFIVLNDPAYIVDGLQRISSGIAVMKEGIRPHIGATIHFNTDKVWEKDRFKTLNQDRVRVSTNILLRNLGEENAAIAALLQLTRSDKAFAMNGRVCWNQQMARSELITALTFAKVIGRLHMHVGPTGNSQVDLLADGLQTVMNAVGKQVFRDNIKTFFDVIDRMYGVKRVTFTRGAVYMRGSFLLALAKLFSNHLEFWKDEKRFFVEAPLVRKLSTFPIGDPHVISLASSGGKAIDLLYLLMVEHVNSGKRTKRLTARNYVPLSSEVDDDAADDGDNPEEPAA